MNFGIFEKTLANDQLLNQSSVSELNINDIIDYTDFFTNSFSHSLNKPLFPKDIAKIWSHPPFKVKHNKLANAFHLIVGDSTEDLIWAWNRTIMSTGQNGRDTLWISYKHFKEAPDSLSALNEWISKVYWSNTGSQSKGCIISSSIPLHELQEIKHTLESSQASILWKAFDDPFHVYGELQTENYWKMATSHTSLEDIGLEILTDCQFKPQRNTLNSTTRLKPPLPPFIENQQSRGRFMVDLDLEYLPFKIKNFAYRLLLPKRKGIAKNLITKNHSRTLNSGKISVLVEADTPFFTINEPSMQSVLSSFGYIIPDRVGKLNDYETPEYTFEISEAGNSLVRLLEVFGSLELAAEFFENPFWVLIGLRFCNIQSLESKEEKELSHIKKILVDASNTIPEMQGITDDIYRKLANNLKEKLNNLRTKDIFLSVNDIAHECNRFLGNMKQQKDTSTNWENADFTTHYKPYLEEYLRRGVVRMGLQLDCSYCCHKSWLLVENLAHKMPCPACGLDIEIPLKPELKLRLNEIVSDTIRQNSLPYVIRELYDQARFPKDMFAFLPCQNVFRKGVTDIFTDLDIVIFRGSTLIIGEVKAEPSGLKSKDFDKLLIAAQQMLPQEVIIVTQDGPVDTDTQNALENLKSELEKHNISFKFKQLKRLATWDKNQVVKKNQPSP